LLCQERHTVAFSQGPQLSLAVCPLSNLIHTKKFQKISFTFLVWSDAETSFLLTMYQENIQNVGPLKKYRNKIALWKGISDEINKKFNSEKTPGQVANKYKNVLAMKNSLFGKKRLSGAGGGNKIPYK
jgi:hypothetical protein